MTATIMTLGDLGLYWLCIGGGLVVGGATAWIVATVRERNKPLLETIQRKNREFRDASKVIIAHQERTSFGSQIARSRQLPAIPVEHGSALEPDTWPAVRNGVRDTRERWERLGKAAAARKDGGQ